LQDVEPDLKRLDMVNPLSALALFPSGGGLCHTLTTACSTQLQNKLSIHWIVDRFLGHGVLPQRETPTNDQNVTSSLI
jgi:hypothetical protein